MLSVAAGRELLDHADGLGWDTAREGSRGRVGSRDKVGVGHVRTVVQTGSLSLELFVSTAVREAFPRAGLRSRGRTRAQLARAPRGNQM